MFYFSPLGLWCSILVFLAYRYRPTFRYWVFYSLGLGSFFHYHLGFSWDLLGSSLLGFSFLDSSHTCRPTYCLNSFLPSCFLTSSIFTFLIFIRRLLVLDVPYLPIHCLVAYTLRLFLYVLFSAVSFNMRLLFSYSEQYLPARDGFSAMFSVKCVVIIVFSWLLTTLLLSGHPFFALSGMLVCHITAVWRFRERRDTLPIALACPLPFLRFSVCVLTSGLHLFPLLAAQWTLPSAAPCTSFGSLTGFFQWSRFLLPLPPSFSSALRMSSFSS